MRLLVALLVLAAVPASARAGTLLSVRADGSGATTLVRAAKTYFGSTPCVRADGAVTALAEHPGGVSDRHFLLARPGKRPRWTEPGGEILDAAFAPGCVRAAELYYSFPDDDEYGSGLLIRDGDKEVARITTVDYEEFPIIAWTSDGTKLAFAGWERGRGETLRVVDARTGRTISRRSTQQAQLGSQAFSPDGDALVYEQSERLLVLETKTGKARALAGGRDGRYLRAPSWSPRGDRIAAVNMGGGIELLDPQAGYGPTLPATDLFTEDITWSPDASTLALRFSHDKRGGPTEWGLAVVGTAPNSRPREVIPRSGSLTLPVWTPDGLSLLVAR